MGLGGPRTRRLAAATAWVAALAPAVARGHGGAEASAYILDPESPGIVVDTAFRFRWFDASDVEAATGTTRHNFYYTRYLPPPWPVFVGPAGLEGTPIVLGVPERATENAYTWDTSTVAAGAYWLWSIAEDPDLAIPSQSIVFSPFPVVVAHEGDRVAPFATLETPDSPAAFAEGDRYELRYTVFDPDQSGQLSLERALEDPGGGAPTGFLAVGDPWSAEPGEGERVIDTSTWPQGHHVLRITIEDGRGARFSSFARHALLVDREAPPLDAGVDDAAPALPDAGPPDAMSEAPHAHPDEPGGGCQCKAPPRSRPFTAGLLALGLIFPLCRRAFLDRAPEVS